MAPVTTFLLAGLATLAAAQNNAPPVAKGAVIGRLRLPVTCQLLGGSQTFDAVISGEAPAYAKAGAQFYITDATGLITIPPNVVQIARNRGAVSAQASTNIKINATGATPASVTAFSGTVPVTFPASGSTTLRFPSGNGTLADIGPFTMGTGAVARTSLGNVNINLALKDASGAAVSTNIVVTCGVQNVKTNLIVVNLDAVNINNATSYNPRPKNGYIPNFPTIPSSTEFGYFRFPYNCTLGALGQQQLDLTLGGRIPTYVRNGASFSLTQGGSFLRIPANLIALSKLGFPSVATFNTNATSVQVRVTNASPAIVDVVKNPPLVSVVDVRNVDTTKDLVIPIPATGTISVGPVTAGVAGTPIYLSVGNATAHTQLRNATGAVLFEFDVQCVPVADLRLAAITVSTVAPTNATLPAGTA
ncbi:uncharacterized protein K489DRAFT_368210 [Dissoconium aciculare CBS 342.82]|uniref:Uncharacterized protein n=1 Tax=Dissoconium aciculare CBS 342.82 TaxID=1314786 RepID=A0A6J3MBJ3_9PEZI|nr:uncharacterized protein K489DRAFT_368210 [Dissoconium aciculare CBS 342.82]KAF1824999.1 hypothetical protein K489DRAFT_368210 [Dissoconium aciculare CBS 342.82]